MSLFGCSYNKLCRELDDYSDATRPSEHRDTPLTLQQDSGRQQRAPVDAATSPSERGHELLVCARQATPPPSNVCGSPLERCTADRGATANESERRDELPLTLRHTTVTIWWRRYCLAL